MRPDVKMMNAKIVKIRSPVLLLKVTLFWLILSLVFSTGAYAKTFVAPSSITINGNFSDWGTVSSPASGVYLFQDASNSGEQDGSGFSGKASDINYFWTAVSTQLGGTATASPSNPIQHLYYRIDTRYNKNIYGQSYYIQLNLGTANPGYADHLLQVWANNSATPKVTLVLYQYNTPYPQIRAFTSGSIVGRVSNIANPYPGFSGVQDSNASGAMGKYDGTNYGIEIKLPVSWYSSTYGGAVTADGTGAPIVTGAVFTGTGSLGAVGTVKDTLNDTAGKTVMSTTDSVTGNTAFVTAAITKIVFTTGAQTITAGQVSSVMTIQTQDATSTPQNVSTTTTVTLNSTSPNGRFDISPTGPFNGSITSVTITSDANSANFYYKDTTAGTPTLTAAETPNQGWTDATQQETIISSVSLPTVTTDNATLVEETTATLNGTIANDGGESCQYQFEYDTDSGEPYTYNTGWTGSKTTGQSFNANITSLSQGIRYYFRAQAKNSVGTSSGPELTFLTKPEAPTGFSASTVSSTRIDLTWTKGTGAARTMIRRATGSYPASRNDGVQVYFDTGTSLPDTSLSPSTTYYYRAWSEVTGSQQWSDGYDETTATTSSAPPPPPPPPPPTAVGGIVYPVDKVRVLTPWLSLFLVLSLAVGVRAFYLRKTA